MKLKLDPVLSSLFEDLDERTYEELKKDIQKNGFQYPLIVAEDGTIVCGHQRYKIAKELEIEPRFTKRKFRDKLEMIECAIACMHAYQKKSPIPKSDIAINIRGSLELEKQNCISLTQLL